VTGRFCGAQPLRRILSRSSTGADAFRTSFAPFGRRSPFERKSSLPSPSSESAASRERALNGTPPRSRPRSSQASGSCPPACSAAACASAQARARGRHPVYGAATLREASARSASTSPPPPHTGRVQADPLRAISLRAMKAATAFSKRLTGRRHACLRRSHVLATGSGWVARNIVSIPTGALRLAL
jgi:hypothetical protein